MDALDVRRRHHKKRIVQDRGLLGDIFGPHDPNAGAGAGADGAGGLTAAGGSASPSAGPQTTPAAPSNPPPQTSHTVAVAPPSSKSPVQASTPPAVQPSSTPQAPSSTPTPSATPTTSSTVSPTTTSTTTSTSTSSTQTSTSSSTSALPIVPQTSIVTAPPIQQPVASQSLPASATPSQSSTPQGAVSGGAVAGIVVGVLGATAVVVILFAVIRRKMRKSDEYDGFRDSMYRNSVMLPDNDFDEKPVIGTRGALALARQNMGHDAFDEPVSQPHMMQAPEASYYPTQWNGYEAHNGYNDQYGNNYQTQGYYDQYTSQAPQHGIYESQDNYGHNGYGDYAQQGAYQVPHNERTSNLDAIARQIDVPAVAIVPSEHNGITTPSTVNGPFSDKNVTDPHGQSSVEYEGRTSPPALGRQLSTSVYGSLSAHQPSPESPVARSGTPVDNNPQQAYLAPGHSGYRQEGASLKSSHRGSVGSGVNEEDPYGGM